jgi:rsbT co-antagonist protein RsbR
MLLDITDDDRRDFALYWELIEKNRDELNARTLAWAHNTPVFAELLKNTPPAEMAKSQQRSLELQRKALLENHWDAYLADARAQGSAYAKMGIDFGSWFELLRAYRVVLAPLAVKHFQSDVDKIVRVLMANDRIIDIAMATIGAAYLEAKQDIISSQSRAIRELSTPVLQVKPRLLILPLVGVIDTERARQVTENVLHAIRARRARAVVIDVTGVPIVDSKVANHLMQTVNAAGLMGAAVIVCGMSPEIAQTLVTIGAELRGVHTTGDLEEAIEEADLVLRARTAAQNAIGNELDGDSQVPLVDGGANQVRANGGA